MKYSRIQLKSNNKIAHEGCTLDAAKQSEGWGRIVSESGRSTE